MDWQSFSSLVRRHWRLLVAGLALGAFGGAIITLLMQPSWPSASVSVQAALLTSDQRRTLAFLNKQLMSFTSTESVAMTPSRSQGSDMPVQDLDSVAAKYTLVLNSESAAINVGRDLGLTVNEVRERTQITQGPNGVIMIVGIGDNQNSSESLVRAFRKELQNQVNMLDGPTLAISSLSNVVQEPTVSKTASDDARRVAELSTVDMMLTTLPQATDRELQQILSWWDARISRDSSMTFPELGMEGSPVVEVSVVTATPPSQGLRLAVTAADDNLAIATQTSERVLEVLNNEIASQFGKAGAETTSWQLVPAEETISGSSPTEDPIPDYRRLMINIAVGSIIGLFLGIGLVLFRASRDTRLTSVSQVIEATGALPLGLITARGSVGQAEALEVPPSIPPFGGYEILEINLGLKRRNMKIVSFAPADDSTSIVLEVVRLAVTHSSSAQNIAIVGVEINIRDFEVVQELRSESQGKQIPIDFVPIQDAVNSGLGDTHTPNVVAILADLEPNYDVIFVVTPSPLKSVTSAAIAAECQGSIICAELGKTDAGNLKATLAALYQAQATILGVVVTEVPPAQLRVLSDFIGSNSY